MRFVALVLFFSFTKSININAFLLRDPLVVDFFFSVVSFVVTIILRSTLINILVPAQVLLYLCNEKIEMLQNTWGASHTHTRARTHTLEPTHQE